MNTNELHAQLAAQAADPSIAGIHIRTLYRSASGLTVTPPAGTLRAGGEDVRGEFTLSNGDLAVTIDSWGSQASRMETAAETLADKISYPLIRFTDTHGGLLTTSARLSHRHADATWRAARAELEAADIPFLDIRNATTTNAAALLRWFPTAILFGWWHSHIANNNDRTRSTKTVKTFNKATADALAGYARLGPDARSARLLTSEIIATGIHRRLRMAARQDTLFGPVAKTKDLAPSELGIGSLPPVHEGQAPVDVTYDTIRGEAFLSLTGLRAFTLTTDPAKENNARALIIALGLLLHAHMHTDLRLRAGTELLVTDQQVTLARHGATVEPFTMPSITDLVTCVAELGALAGWDGERILTIGPDSVIRRLLDRAEPEAETDQS